MIDSLTFLNLTQLRPLLIGISVIGCFYVWKEWKHFGTFRFWVKMIIATTTLFALAMLALKPAIKVESSANKAVIITANYKQARLDSLKAIHTKIKSFKYVPNKSLFKSQTAIRSVFVLGEGLEPYDFWQLDDKNATYLGDTLPSGIIKFAYDLKKTEGQQLQFKGMYRQPKVGTQLSLRGPGGVVLDSLELVTKNKQPFQFNVQLKASGKYVYKLIEKEASGKHISQHFIPVEVKKRAPLKVLIINGFPSFESKYLKNFLAENGHEVLVRSQVTKARFKFEYFNTKKRTIGRFTIGNLKAYDLVVMDKSSLSNLENASRKALENAIKQEGLGLFIQANTSFFNTSKGTTNFVFKGDKKTNTSIATIPNIKVEKQPFQFSKGFGLESLLVDNSNAILAAYKHKGSGRVGSSVLTNTYELILKGQTKQYKQLWTAIIQGLSKRNEKTTEWVSNANLATKNHPFPFKLRFKNSEVPEVKTNGDYRIAMKNDIDFPNLWEGKTYPINTGWQSLRVTADSSSVFNYFVQDTLSWNAKMSYDKIKQNNRFFGKAMPEIKSSTILKPISPLWFFVIFLVGVSLLWLLPKVWN